MTEPIRHVVDVVGRYTVEDGIPAIETPARNFYLEDLLPPVAIFLPGGEGFAAKAQHAGRFCIAVEFWPDTKMELCPPAPPPMRTPPTLLKLDHYRKVRGAWWGARSMGRDHRVDGAGDRGPRGGGGERSRGLLPLSELGDRLQVGRALHLEAEQWSRAALFAGRGPRARRGVRSDVRRRAGRPRWPAHNGVHAGAQRPLLRW